MSSRDIRNGILTLIILAIGVKLILYITGTYIDISSAGEIGKSLDDIGTLFIYGALAIAVLLVPFYLSARGKGRQQNNDIIEKQNK
jgi:hypothetical protein